MGFGCGGDSATAPASPTAAQEPRPSDRAPEGALARDAIATAIEALRIANRQLELEVSHLALTLRRMTLERELALIVAGDRSDIVEDTVDREARIYETLAEVRRLQELARGREAGIAFDVRYSLYYYDVRRRWEWWGPPRSPDLLLTPDH